MVESGRSGYGGRLGRASLAALAVLALGLVAGCRQQAAAPTVEPDVAPVAFHAQGEPELLSQWQLLRMADGRLQPNAGVLPYELNTPLFTDYAHKLRTLWMPEGVSARYTDQGSFEFPVGTIISKTFYYPRVAGEAAGSPAVLRSDGHEGALPDGGLALDQVRLVETRLLVRRQEGWLALPYVWNPEQTEARLMRGGELVDLDLVDGQGGHEAIAYQVPDQNQCAGCHGSDMNSRDVHPIGPMARHLNRDVSWLDADGTPVHGNQLQHWQQLGYLDGLPEAAEVPRVADWRDPQASVDARARAYLDINCAHCHSPVGPGATSGLWLASEVDDPLRLGRCKLPIAAGHGTGGHRFGIMPGQPDESILLYRMISTDPGVMMPELGRSLVHTEGVDLIRQWIAEQEGKCEEAG